ncbi:MAG: four helix bundle protein [Ferruginibacter sp.]|nr:four helix bundle protein [Cytophagales bacterium]
MKSKENSIIREKSFAFAVRMVNLYKFLCEERKEYVLSKQVLRSGTSIGANVNESLQAQSKKDFVAKLSIALKEASETEYWLLLLRETKFIDESAFSSTHQDCVEIIKITTAIIKTAKNNQ